MGRVPVGVTRRLALVALALIVAVAGAVVALGARGAAALPTVPPGFGVTIVAHVPQARELAFSPNGDLFVGTEGDDVDVIPDADADGRVADPRDVRPHRRRPGRRRRVRS